MIACYNREVNIFIEDIDLIESPVRDGRVFYWGLIR